MNDNKQLVRDLIDALFSRGELDAVDKYLSPDFVNHDPVPGFSAGREGFRELGGLFRTAFPDWHSELESLIAEDDLVAERFTARGTHRGEIMGAAPTGKEVAYRGINIFRIADGQITERWGRLDDLGFLRQIGLVPS